MYLTVGLHGHLAVLLARFERGADGVDAGHEFAIGAEHVEDLLAHAGHRAHVGDDVGGVGDFEADVGDRRTERAHRERDDVHRAALHAALEQPFRVSRMTAGSSQLLVGPASSFLAEQM